MNKRTSSSSGFWKPNLGSGGRWLRGVAGLVMVVAGLLLVTQATVLGAAFLASGAFVLFEAARGWCVLRACGIRTKF